MRSNEKYQDKQMIQYDNMKAQEYADYQKALKDQQRKILRDANLQ